MGEITRQLDRFDGDPSAAGPLFDRLYPELYRLARARMRTQPPGVTLQTTGLVHEAYLRLVNGSAGRWPGRELFFAHAAKVMRSILVDHARRRSADKRHGGRRTSLTEVRVSAKQPSIEILSLDVALDELRETDPERAELTELVVYGGLTLMEIAQLKGLSHTTVRRRWRVIRNWLRHELGPESELEVGEQ